MTERIPGFKDLRVYQLAFELQQELFMMSKLFPPEERYALTDQLRRSAMMSKPDKFRGRAKQ